MSRYARTVEKINAPIVPVEAATSKIRLRIPPIFLYASAGLGRAERNRIYMKMGGARLSVAV